MANPEDDLLSKLFLDVEAILATPGSSLSATGVSSADETLADLWHLWLSRISPLRESSRKVRDRQSFLVPHCCFASLNYIMHWCPLRAASQHTDQIAFTATFVWLFSAVSTR